MAVSTQFVIKNKFEIQHLLSEDLVSFCYQGRQLDTKQNVLIWQYKADMLDPKLAKQLIKRAERLIGLSNPHCLMLLDYFYDGNTLFTIYQHEDYVPLEDYLKDNPTWDLKTLWNLVTQLLEAMLFLESKGVGSGAVHLNSVGVSKNNRIVCTKIDLHITVLKHIWSTVSVIDDCVFYPPEWLHRQERHATHDIYSFGVMMDVFFSKSWPYKLTYDVDQLKSQMIHGYQPFEPASPKLPARLGPLIHKCIHPDPSQRFTSFVDLVKAYKGLTELPMHQSMDSPVIHDIREEVAAKKQRQKEVWTRLGTIALSVFAFCIVVMTGYHYYLTSIPEVTIPNIVGVSEADAQRDLDELGLRSEISGARVHPYYPKGVVIESKPPFGRSVKSNRLIRLVVSSGSGQIFVPDLLGRSKDQADGLLMDRGFQVEVVDELFSVQYPSGFILEQTPSANMLVDPQSVVSLVLSKGVPIELTVKKASKGLFFNQKKVVPIAIEFSLLDEWPSQEVTIYFTVSGAKEKLYSDIHDGGETVSLEFNLEQEGQIDVLFGSGTVLSETVTFPETP